MARRSSRPARCNACRAWTHAGEEKRRRSGGKLLAEGHAKSAQVVPDQMMKPRVQLAHLVNH
eukprot:55104-Prymnesium_polylepis.2